MTTPQDLQNSVNALPWDNITGSISGEDIEGLWNQCVAIFEAMGGTVWATVGIPSSNVGNNGDFAIDQTNKFIYGPKASGTWTEGQSFGGGGSAVVTTVAGLATAFPSPAIGDQAMVTDAISCVFGAGVTGGAVGVPSCPVFWNGSAWAAG